jgi:hypothetical protein
LAVLTQAGEVTVPLLPAISRRRVAIFNDRASTLNTMATWCEMHGHGAFNRSPGQLDVPHLHRRFTAGVAFFATRLGVATRPSSPACFAAMTFLYGRAHVCYPIQV